jgi:predicted phage terminase large subunit-like protein
MPLNKSNQEQDKPVLDVNYLMEHPEMLQQELSRRSLVEFCKDISVEPAPAEHHRLILEALERVERKEITRLMLFLPPGSAKSTYASKLFPSWYMGRNVRDMVIGASHVDELAQKFGREVRNYVRTPEYKDIFGITLDPEIKAAGRWANTKGGEYYAVGVGGSITGRRADLAIIDDPVKGREEADSESTRNRIWEWYKSDFRTRLKPNAAVVIIQTRWHEDDLSGRILPEDYDGQSGMVTARDGEEWYVVSIPMFAERDDDPLKREKGEILWKEWWSEDAMKQERITQGERNWSALYQQRPSPDTGNYFMREWIKTYHKEPEEMKIYGASDYAVTAKGGDFTVHMVVGIDEEDNIYVLDLWREKTESSAWVEAFIDLVMRYRPLQWAEESGQIARGVGPFITKRQRETKAFCFRKQYSSSKDKATRAQAIRARISQGMVFFPENALWLEDAIREVVHFPAGKHDDIVDVLSLIGRMMEDMGRPIVRKADDHAMFDVKDHTWELDMTFNDLVESNKQRRLLSNTYYL